MALAGALAAAAGVPVRASDAARLTGDEPHYLVTALSLAGDGDLDVSDEIAAGDYRPFHEPELAPQGEELAGGRVVEPHEPLLPALLAAPAALGGWPAAKGVLAVAAGLLAALLLWTAVVRLGVPLGAAAVVVSAFALSAPFAVYGSQLYPELPAALAVAGAAAALTGPLGGAAVAVVGLAAVVLPTLSTKYALLSAALVALALARLVRAGRRRAAGLLGGGLALAALAYLAAHRAWYGGLTPYAAGRHFRGGELTAVGSDPSYLGRSVRHVALLVDETFGLAAWQPAWLLAVPALAALLRARPGGWAVLAAPLAVGWLTAVHLAATMHGWWWPGRHVVAILPLAVLVLAWWVGRSRRRLALSAVVGLLGVATYAWTLAEGWAGAINWVVTFHETSNPWLGAWRGLLPAYAGGGAAWAAHGAWLALVALLAAAGWAGGRPREATPDADAATTPRRAA